MHRFVVPVLLAILLQGYLRAQTPADRHQAFLDLRSDYVLMDLSAHPDDEDGSSLAYYRYKLGVKTYSVLFTRGEGGQNEKGPQLYEELGVLRSAETEAAGNILGADVRFLNLLDFGYSKTATEAFQKWGGQMEVLRRLVFMIRKLKPDVVFTNHTTIDGHGHHQAVAITAIAAFDAAADSTLFPDQLLHPGVTLWQPRKLFFRGWGQAQPIFDVSNDIGGFDSARGVAYIDIASQALRMHKTQGLDRADLRRFTRGRALYKLMRQNSMYEGDTTSFFSGINFWDDPSLARLRPVRARLSGLREGEGDDRLLRESSDLLSTVDSLAGLPGFTPLARRILAHWQSALSRIAMMACGTTVSFDFKDPVVVARQRVSCELRVASPTCSISNVRCQFATPTGWTVQEDPEAAPDARARSFDRLFTATIGDDPHLTLPRTTAQYGSLEAAQEITVNVSFVANGCRLHATVAPKFDVAPFTTLKITPGSAGLMPQNRRAGVVLNYTITNFLPHKTAGRMTEQLPPGWSAEPVPFVIDKEDSSVSGTIRVTAPDDVKSGTYPVTFRTDYAKQTVPVNVFDVRVAPDLLVGVVKSYDNTFEDALADLGVRYALLTEEDLRSGDLSKFSTILIDIRAYLVREDLKRWNSRLLEYVREGGNVLVMYQRDQEWKPEYAPYPFQITRARVSVEEAPVLVLQPEHPLLTTPNRITASDWLGWKQERALYFPGDVAPEYTRLLSCNDPDEEPLTTGYLVAHSGKGSYIYTSYVWYRQLKDDNPGAFRCFANMISYAATRK